MFKFADIIDIPEFIKGYIYDNQEIENITYSFCEELLKINWTKDDKKLFSNIQSGIIKRFVEFYLEQTQLDEKYNCRYETELEMSKLLIREVFKVYIDGTIYNLIIDSYEDNILTLEIVL